MSVPSPISNDQLKRTLQQVTPQEGTTKIPFRLLPTLIDRIERKYGVHVPECNRHFLESLMEQDRTEFDLEFEELQNVVGILFRDPHQLTPPTNDHVPSQERDISTPVIGLKRGEQLQRNLFNSVEELDDETENTSNNTLPLFDERSSSTPLAARVCF